MKALLVTYTDMILSLVLGNYRGNISLSKPLYLLSLIECVSYGKLCSNKINFDDVYLQQMFISKYEKVYGERTCCLSTFLKPFYHLASSPFYHLIWKCGSESPSMSYSPSAKYLREHLLYAKLDDELWELLQDAESREYIKDNIIRRYLNKQP